MPAIPAYPNLGRRIRQYPIAAAQTYLDGAAVLLVADEVTECGADPAVILGFAQGDAGVDPDPTLQLVACAVEGSTFMMQGDRTPVATDEGVSYGIVKDADGIWIVDTTDTTATRVTVEKVYIDKELYEVSVLPANRQLAG